MYGDVYVIGGANPQSLNLNVYEPYVFLVQI